MIVVDTGVLYALADRDDAHHAACVRWLATARGPLIVPPPVIAEACYLIGRHLGPGLEAAFLDSFGPGQAFTLGTLLELDLTRMAALVRQYADLPLGGTDAAVIATAERLDITEVATVDRRHFSVVRPQHARAFTVLPAEGSLATTTSTLEPSFQAVSCGAQHGAGSCAGFRQQFPCALR